MAEIALKITTNFSKAEKEIHALGAVTDAEAKRFAKYNAAFTPDNIEKWTQSNRRAVAAIEATQGPLKAAAANQRNLERKIQGAIRNGINPEDERLQGLRAELVKASERTEALTNEQKAMGRSMDTAANRTEKLTKSQASLGKVARAAAIGIAALAAAVGLGAKKAVGAFVDYREAIANVNTLVPISAGEFENLDGKLKQVSEELGIQKKELAGGVYQAISASVEGYKDLAGALEITEQAAKLATGANTTNAQSVDIITTAMSAYGPTVVDASKASDVFFQIIKSGKIDGEQLSSVIGQAISNFATAGIKIEELGAGLATMTKLGVSASESTTKLNALVKAFIKPSEAMGAALQAAGYASGQALLETKGLSGAIEFLNQTAGGNVTILGQLLTNERAYAAATVLAANEGKAFNSTLAEFGNVSGTTVEAVKKQLEGYNKLGAQLDIAKVKITNLMEAIGERLVPVVITMVNKFEDFMETNKGLIDTFIQMAPAIVTTTAAVLGLTVAVTGIMKIVKAFQAVKLGMSALKALANPMATLIVAGILAIVAVVVILVKHWDKIKAAITGAWEKLKAFAKAAWGIIKKVGKVIFGLMRVLVPVINIPIEIVKLIRTHWSDIVEWIANKIRPIVDWFKYMGGMLKDVFEKAVAWVKSAFAGLQEKVLEIMHKIGTFFRFTGAILKEAFLIATKSARKVFVNMLAFTVEKIVDFANKIGVGKLVTWLEAPLKTLQTTATTLETEVKKSRDTLRDLLAGGMGAYAKSAEDAIGETEALTSAIGDTTKETEKLKKAAEAQDKVVINEPTATGGGGGDTGDTYVWDAKEKNKYLRFLRLKMRETEKFRRESEARLLAADFSDMFPPPPPTYWQAFSDGIASVRSEADLLNLAFVSAFRAMGDSAEEAGEKTKAVMAAVMNVAGQINDMVARGYEMQLNEIEHVHQAEISALNSKRDAEIAAATAWLTDEGEKQRLASEITKRYADEQKKIDQEMAMEKYEIEKQQFEAKKLADAASVVMAGIVAAMQAWQLGAPAGPILAAVIAGISAANVAQIMAQKPPPPPQFQTGGRFVVPGSVGARPDNVGLRVNPGETIDVTPRGVSQKPIRIVVNLDGRAIVDVVQQAMDRGEFEGIEVNTEAFVR